MIPAIVLTKVEALTTLIHLVMRSIAPLITHFVTVATTTTAFVRNFAILLTNLATFVTNLATLSVNLPISLTPTSKTRDRPPKIFSKKTQFLASFTHPVRLSPKPN
jgi:hypothetical protein